MKVLGEVRRMEHPRAAVRSIKCWSREWWAALLARIERGERCSFVIAHACHRGSRAHTELAAHMPPAEAIARLKAYPSDGEAMKAWQPWFKQHGVTLPTWGKRFWVFLPAPCPPPDGRPVWQSTDEAA